MMKKLVVTTVALIMSFAAMAATVSKADDKLTVQGCAKSFDVGETVAFDVESDLMAVDSGSDYTISITGLPKGLAYDAKKKRISGKTTKRGVYYVKFYAKNVNGFSTSETHVWNVGNAGNGDYDKINLSDMCDLSKLDNLRVGESFFTSGYNVSTVSGLPSGLSWTKGKYYRKTDGTWYSGVIRGTPTKAGKFVIEFAKGKLKTRKTVIVKDEVCSYLKVGVATDCAGRGTVSGGGVKRRGTTIKLSAKPARNRYFAGWYTDEFCLCPFEGGKSGNYRKQDETFTLRYDSPRELYARFVTKSEDSYVEFGGSDSWYVKTDVDADESEIGICSETRPSLTVKGLPAGIKVASDGPDAECWAYYRFYVSDKSKLKPGYHTVTLTAKNLSGEKATKKMQIVVPNIQSDVFSDIRYDEAYSFTVGVPLDCVVYKAFDYEDGWSVKASGLPSGLKLNSSYGSGTFQGMATKTGTYTVTLTATKGKLTEKATITLIVEPYPTDYVGSYGGDVLYQCSSHVDYGTNPTAVGTIGDLAGTFSMSVASSGKIGIKFNAEGKSVSLSGYSCGVYPEYLELMLDSKSGSCNLLTVPADDGFGTLVTGTVSTVSGSWNVRARRNVAKSNAEVKTVVTRLSKIGIIKGYAISGDIMCPQCMEVSDGGKRPTPNVSFTVDTSGKVKSSGKISGRTLSGSAQLQVLDNGKYRYLVADFCDMSKSAPLLYRIIFDWDQFFDSGTVVTAGNVSFYGGYYVQKSDVCYKPVIYLYPETETECSVQLTLNGRLTCTYPDYGLSGWRDFIAAPDGTLTFADGKQYYCLYWEGETRSQWDFSRGYCVKGSETGDFLAEVLPEMGLNFREANEFIIYWLPLMQDNPYNVIAFQGDGYTSAAKLEIEPEPDSLLRVFMAWKPSEKAVDIEAPVIKPFERKGFTVVEWGGSKVAE